MTSGSFDTARASGLDCLTGGSHLRDKQWLFVEPTIYRDVPMDHTIWREEIFGTVLALTPFATTEQAVAIANDTDYGLAATVVGTDLAPANAIASRIDAGHIWVNSLS